jgi:hypothetical protein
MIMISIIKLRFSNQNLLYSIILRLQLLPSSLLSSSYYILMTMYVIFMQYFMFDGDRGGNTSIKCYTFMIT